MKILPVPILALVLFLTQPLAHAQAPIVIFITSMGTLQLELDDARAPVSVANFLQYVDSGFYVKTIFHRVVPGFVVQGGGMEADMIEKPTLPPIVNEAKGGLSNLRGTLGMARTEEINSATSEFFINLKDNTRLDYRDDGHYGYAVFGRVSAGMEIVDAMAGVTTKTVGEYENVPVEPIVVFGVNKVYP